MTRRLAITAALLLLLIPTLLFAQSDATIEFYGAIQSANSTGLVVNGQIVDIRDAQVNAPLVVGMTVRVTASFAADGGLIARSVDAIAPGAIPGIVAISGFVTDSSDKTITIGGQVIDVSETASGARPVVGLPLTVYAVAHGAGNWQAAAVIAGGSAPVAAETPPAPAATPEVAAPAETPDVQPPAVTPEVSAPAATPEVGAPAATPEADGGETYTLEGTLEAVGSRAIIVDGQRYDVGSARRDGTLVVGARVRLELRVVGNQAVLERIKVID